MIEVLKQRALHRSKILLGQLKGLEKKIENEDYCMDILTQSLAIQRSLGSLNKLLLENHLKTCAKDQMGSNKPAEQEKAIAELLHLYELHNVKGK